MSDENNVGSAAKRFVNLHGHSTFSIGDAIGLPQDHIDFAVGNGLDALALTDHGNMNGFSHQYLHSKKLQAKGVNFKPIYGCEFYFVPSLSEWRKAKTAQEQEKAHERALKAAKKNAKASGKTEQEEFDAIGRENEDTPGGVAPSTDDDELGGTIVENEEESKSANKWQDPIKRRNHLVVVAKNSEGLRALYRLVSNSYADGFYMYPRIDLEMLKREAKGNLIATSACVAGADMHIISKHQTEPDWSKWGPNDTNKELIQAELKDLIEQFKDALGEENYYLEMQFNKLGPQHLKNYHLIEAAKRTNTKLVVTVDAHYSNPDHWKEREIYKAMAWASKTKNYELAGKIPEKIEELKCQLYPKNAQQLWETYLETGKSQHSFYDDSLVRDAIERTWSIAHEQIEVCEPDRSVKLPVISKLVSKSHINEHFNKLGNGVGEDAIAFEELKTLAKEGLKKRGFAENEEYIQRLVYELGVIKKLKFAKYFLTYAKIMELVSKQQLIGTARGSAGGSLLAYCIGVTQLDPIRFGLLFERFLVPNKKGYPDIDSDFSDREKAVEIIAAYFGAENVIPVTNFNQLQLRSLIKDIARLNGIPHTEINGYTSKIESECLQEAKKADGFDRAQWVLTYDEAERNSPSFQDLMVKYPDFEKTIKVLFKQMRNVSRHAGGVIISDSTREGMPMIKSGDMLQTPWPEGLNARHLEDFGLLKFDILGLGTLRMFEECIRKIIKKETGHKYVTFEQVQDWFYKKLHSDNNTLDDPKVYKNVYWDSHYTGIFQFVQPNVQKFMADMKPKNIIDIATATSIFRPGPLGIDADKQYLNNRKNPEKIVYKHPLLKEVLSSTAGLIIFQEQLQLIYNKLAGVPLEETDAVRKAFTKKDLSNKEKAEKERLAMREDFALKCLAANDIPKNVSYDIFDEMQKYVAYSFNKSHAVAYAIISYQCSWLLTYYPDEWVTTYIDYCATSKGKVTGKEDPKSVALSEAKGLGYTIGKPDINLSERDYTIQDNKLIPSFSSLKYVGTTVLKEIADFRPYRTIEELLFNSDDSWRHSKFNKRAMSTLVRLEAFGSMDLVGEGKLFSNYRQLHYVLVEKADALKRACSNKKKTHKEDLQTYILEAKELPDWDLPEKVAFSRDLSGSVDLALIVTPEIADYFANENIVSIDDRSDDEQWVWCIVKSSQVAKTKSEKPKDYLRMRVYGQSGQDKTVFCWNFKPAKDKPIPENSLIIGRFKESPFGYSAFFGGLEVIGR